MKLDFTSLKKAILQLEKSLEYCNSDLAKDDKDLALQLRAASIQAFEYTYELCWKMLKRYLETTEPNPAEIDRLSFGDLIRLGNERGLLLSNLKKWNVYRASRNITSHTYDENRALQVFSKLPSFLEEAKFLLNELEMRMET